MSIYPNAIDGFEQLPLIIDGITPVNAFSVNALREAILNLEIELGITPSGDAETVSERLTIMQSLLETGIPPDVEARMVDIEDSVLALEAVVNAMVDNLHSYTNDVLAVAVGDVVYQDSIVDNKVFIANANNGATNIIVGVVAELIDNSNSIVCSTGGIVTGLSGLIKGEDYWLSTFGTTGNTLTTIKPITNAYFIGVALSATSMLVSISPFETGIGEHLTDLQALPVTTIADEIMVSTAAGVWALESGTTARTSLGLTIGTDVQAFDTHLEDLATLTPATIADEIMVSTAAGVWALESGATARTSLGLAIGSDVQAFDTHLEDLAALTPASAADEIMVSTAAGVWALESGNPMRISLGLAIGSDVQAFDTHLEDLAALTPASAADQIMVSTAAGVWALESGTTARTSLGLTIGTDVQAFDTHLEDLATLTPATIADQIMVSTAAGVWALESGTTARTSLGLTIGSDVQAFDAHLEDLAALATTTTANQIMVSTGVGTWALEDGATARTSLGLAIGSDVQAFDTHLEDLAALTPATIADQIMVSTGAGTWALESGATARTSLGLGTTDAVTHASIATNGSIGDTGVDMGNATLIKWDNASLAGPTLSTRSIGTRYIFWNSLSSTRADWAEGMEAGYFWWSVADLNTTTQGWKWYGATTKVAELNNAGDLQLREHISGDYTSGYGSFWVKNDTPNTPYFTDGAGTPSQLQYQSAHLDDLAALTTATIPDQIMVSTGAGTWALENGTTARTSLGLAIGSDVQAFDTHLEDLAALTPASAADQIMVSTGAGTWALESGATMRTSLGLAIGSDVQAWDTNLDQIAALTASDSYFIVGSGSSWVRETGTTARTSIGLGTGDSPTFTAITLTATNAVNLGTNDRISWGAATYINGDNTSNLELQAANDIINNPVDDTFWKANGGATTMRYDGGTQRLGINQTSPSYTLDVEDNTTSFLARFANTNTGTDADGVQIAVGAASPGSSNFFLEFRGTANVGEVKGNGTGIDYSTTSDRLLKKNIVDAPKLLPTLMDVQFRAFDWKLNDTHEIGVIAQELLKVWPRAVGGDKTTRNSRLLVWYKRRKNGLDKDGNRKWETYSREIFTQDEVDAMYLDSKYQILEARTIIEGQDPEYSYMTVDYSRLIPLIGKSTQELAMFVTLQNNKINAQAALIEDQIVKLAVLTTRISTLESL